MPVSEQVILKDIFRRNIIRINEDIYPDFAD